MGKDRGNRLTVAWPRLITVVLCAAILTAALNSCRNVVAPPPCMPPAFTVIPAEVKPGDMVTVSAPDAGCDARYGQAARVRVELLNAAGTPALDELAPMTDDGGFTLVFTVPADMSPGEAGVTAYPYNLDWCDDTGVNNRAAAGPPTLARVSCAQRLVPLVILAG
jgi:hypothetical protein